MSWWNRVLGRKTGDLDPQVPIRFDTDGWTRRRHAPGSQEWTDPLGNTLRLEVASGLMPHLIAATDLSALREWCRRNAAQREGAIVSVDVVEVQSRQGLQVIEKFERRPSYDYEGTLVLPLGDGHCRLSIRASEHGTTGTREAVISGHLVALGELDLSSIVDAEGLENGVPIPGWCADPYDPAYTGKTLLSLADDPRVDGLFPDHPLSRVRITLARLHATIAFSDVDGTEAGAKPAFAPSGEVSRTDHEMSGLAVGMLLLQMGRAADAQAILAESLKRHTRNVNADPARVAAEWEFLGFAHEALGQLEQSEAAFHEAAKRFAASLGERHYRTALAVNNRARILIMRRDADGAEPLFRFSLDVFEREGLKTSDAALALNGLGLVHIAREQYRDAVDCFERAVGIFERVHGPAFREIGPALRNMALAWKRLGDLERMADAWQRAEEVDKASKRVARR